MTEWPVLRKKAVKESSSEDEEEVANSFKKQRLQRRRAYSENVMTPVITRIMSESDLSRIDRNATFGTAAVIEPGVLLARVVDALGTPIGSRFELSDDEDDRKVCKIFITRKQITFVKNNINYLVLMSTSKYQY